MRQTRVFCFSVFFFLRGVNLIYAHREAESVAATTTATSTEAAIAVETWTEAEAEADYAARAQWKCFSFLFLSYFFYRSVFNLKNMRRLLRCCCCCCRLLMMWMEILWHYWKLLIYDLQYATHCSQLWREEINRLVYLMENSHDALSSYTQVRDIVILVRFQK